MTAKPLSTEQIQHELKLVPKWLEAGSQISRTYQFKNFVAAIVFVKKIAEYSERVQHHPDILIRYNKVTLSVNTHDAGPEGGGGAITSKDFDLARAADAAAGVCD